MKSNVQLSTVSLKKTTKSYKKDLWTGDVHYGSPGGGAHSDFPFIFHFSIFPKWRSKNRKVRNKNEITMLPPWACVDWWNFPQRKLVWYFLFFSENCWILRCLVIDPLTLLTLCECVWEFFGSKVTSLYSGHCRDLNLVSLLARVRNSGSLFQSNVYILQFIFAWDLAVVRITGVYVIAGCPQGESWV